MPGIESGVVDTQRRAVEHPGQNPHILDGAALQHPTGVNLGFDGKSVSIVRIDLAGNRYRPEDGTAMFQKLLSRISLRPEVESAALAKSVPLGFGDQERVKITPELQQPVDEGRTFAPQFACLAALCQHRLGNTERAASLLDEAAIFPF